MVSFELSEEQKLLRDTCRDFALTAMRKYDRQSDESGEIPSDIVKQGHELGLTTGYIPETYGGPGGELSALNGVIILEELAYGNLSMALNILAPSLVNIPLVLYGTEDQKKKYFGMNKPDQFHGFTAALAEPAVKFDPEALRTAAADEIDDFVLNGEKAFVAIADSALATIVFARKGSGEGLAGIDGFIVPSGGFTVKEREKNQGLRALKQFTISLEGTRVPRSDVLRLSGGFAGLLARARTASIALTTGVCRAAYEYALAYAKERIAFGEPIASRQSVAFTLAEMAMEVDAMRLMAWRSAWMIDKGIDAYKDASMGKRYAADAAMFVTRNATQVLGGHGFTRDHPVEMWYRDARSFAVSEFMAIV
ncbi:MAG: acyl-CoA dehydrogenase family protein [Deltaproteobacteria bacterium]|nr:acyl-CoA dehydrogenase family protein [Deltaproteobacteria bacterium]MCL5276447.1 acyl-CoA dehydrogenase family protein [Deltaproteobacteria bacterium]